MAAVAAAFVSATSAAAAAAPRRRSNNDILVRAGRHPRTAGVVTSATPRTSDDTTTTTTNTDVAATAAAAAAAERSPSRREALATSLAAVAFSTTTQAVVTRPASAESLPKVVVVGATGQTGALVVEALRKRGGADVIAAVRSPDKAKKMGLDAGGVTLLPGFDVTGRTGFLHFRDAAKAAGVKRVVLVSSILTDGRAMGAQDSPGFKITNAFGGVLDEKLVGEKHLQASGVEYTIVRPAGLRGDRPKTPLILTPGNVMASGEVSRELVAEVMVEAAFAPRAANKIVEIAEEGTFAPGYTPEGVEKYLVGIACVTTSPLPK